MSDNLRDYIRGSIFPDRGEDYVVHGVQFLARMDGGELDDETIEGIRRVYRGETTADEESLAIMERQGYGDTRAAQGIRARIEQTKRNCDECS